MKRFSLVALCVVALVVVLLSGEKCTAADPVTCDPAELAPCLEAFTSPTPPSDICCSNLKEQSPCLCGYLEDPNIGKYFVGNPNAERVAKTCGIPYPIQC
ncbi:hypothetical protein DITRI_Ditri05aG0161600 [Diplodiscus trichospermus]